MKTHQTLILQTSADISLQMKKIMSQYIYTITKGDKKAGGFAYSIHPVSILK